jgi:hypothetical protein
MTAIDPINRANAEATRLRLRSTKTSIVNNCIETLRSSPCPSSPRPSWPSCPSSTSPIQQHHFGLTHARPPPVTASGEPTLVYVGPGYSWKTQGRRRPLPCMVSISIADGTTENKDKDAEADLDSFGKTRTKTIFCFLSFSSARPPVCLSSIPLSREDDDKDQICEQSNAAAPASAFPGQGTTGWVRQHGEVLQDGA